MRSLLLAATIVLALAACGSEERGASEPSRTSPTLDSWVTAVCDVENSDAAAEASEPPADPSELFSAEQTRKELQTGRAGLRGSGRSRCPPSGWPTPSAISSCSRPGWSATSGRCHESRQRPVVSTMR